ncbi:MAG: hypothetical protein SCK29_11185 [Bacillota bacterium]|nr:hypothetical protein [Bacillota bacterium]MDW7684668.1 hypothetical protein [Bacillota bacterium]
MSEKKKPDAGAAAEKVTLEVVERSRRRLMEFESEEERDGWEKAYRKGKWYTPYFLLGMFFNFILYKAGLDLSSNILWGLVVGVGVPIATMLLFTELHYRLFMSKTTDS